MVQTPLDQNYSDRSRKASRVYVLGAGFSKSYNPSTVPLMADFLQMAKSYNRYNIDGEHKNLARFIARYFGIAEYHDLEKVMSFLSAPALDDPSVQYENRSLLYHQLIQVIQETLSLVHVGRPSETISQYYENFAEHLVSSRSSVITFNYDLLLDSLLYRTGKWIGYDGYGADIPSAYQALPRPARRSPSDYVPPDENRSRMYLLKLHGSINWGVPTLHPESDSALYQDPHGCYHQGFFRGERVGPSPLNGSTFGPRELSLSMRFEPFLVPPILDKTSLLKNRTLRVLWNIARESISKADELVFIGYSLPTTDFAAEFLFRQAVKTSKQKKVSVVAPNATGELMVRYTNLFGEAVKAFDGDTMAWMVESSKTEFN